MKVKGGGRKKSGEAVPVVSSIAGENLGGDSYNHQPPNGSSSDNLQQKLLNSQLEPQEEEALMAEDAPDLDENENDAEADDYDDNAERPKLEEGFYEIETIRRKRVRKGQLQYLIKWRGWPETANTWEPVANLQACSDVIEAFEESLRSGKSRKKKRKVGTPYSQPKKKQQRSTATDNGLEAIDVDKALASAAAAAAALDNVAPPSLPVPSQSLHSAHLEENNGNSSTIETRRKSNLGNGFVNGSQQKKKGNEYDPKLSELKSTDKVATNIPASEGNGSVGGFSKGHSVEPAQNNRSTGARRRKSGSVKRFKQEQHSCEAVVQNLTSGTSIVSASRVERLDFGSFDVAGENSSQKNRSVESRGDEIITKIIKPIGYTATVANNTQDVLVTFMAMRSDGREVMVDNKFLKTNNPLLLINFYEQHLRYNPTS